MNLKEALAIVIDLASDNSLDESFKDDAVLGEEYEKQNTALEIVISFRKTLRDK